MSIFIKYFYFNVRFSDNFNGSLVPALPFILPFTTGLGGGVVSVVLTGLETELFGRALSVAFT